jgi:NHL repeat
VLVYGAGGSLIAKWGAGEGDGAAGGGQSGFNHPSAIALNSAGDVYVADTNNNRIVELSSGGTVLNEWGSRGTASGRFREPDGVAVDGAGDVYVSDRENYRVQMFDPNGRFLAKWGLRGTGLGEFSMPSAIAVDCNGDVYVADTNNNRVERFDPLAANPSGCLPAGSWPPPLDVPPVLHVTLARHTGVLARRALALGVSCRRGCEIFVTAALSPPGRRGAVTLVAAARRLPPSLTGHVRLRVGAATLRRLRHELGRNSGMRARVKIIASGPTGRRTSLTRVYTVTR